MMQNLVTLLSRLAYWIAVLFCIPGGALWALTPLGIQLADQRLPSGSARFWQLFSLAPMLLLVGLAGVWLVGCLGSGWIARLSLVAACLGLLIVVFGNVGQFWFGLDDIYPVTAPAYRAFRIGLLVLAVSAATLGVSSAYERALPIWAALPFTVAAFCGLVAFLGGVEELGPGLWSAFGAGWIWLGFSVALVQLVAIVRDRPQAGPSMPTPEANSKISRA